MGRNIAVVPMCRKEFPYCNGNTYIDDTDSLAGDFQRKDSVLDWKLWVISECSCF